MRNKDDANSLFRGKLRSQIKKKIVFLKRILDCMTFLLRKQFFVIVQRKISYCCGK